MILLEATGLTIMDLEQNTRLVLASSMYKLEPYNYEFQNIKANYLPRFKYVSAYSLLSPPATLTSHLRRLTECSPTIRTCVRIHSFGNVLSPVVFSARAC